MCIKRHMKIDGRLTLHQGSFETTLLSVSVKNTTSKIPQRRYSESRQNIQRHFNHDPVDILPTSRTTLQNSLTFTVLVNRFDVGISSM